MRRITNPRKLAAKIYEVVLEDKHYDQTIWISQGYFDNRESYIDTIATLRKTYELNLCGSTACVAGNAVIFSLPAGAVVDFWDTSVRYKGSHEEVQIDEAAQAALGLNGYQANWLFSATRSREDVLNALRFLMEGDYAALDAYIDRGWFGDDNDDE